MKEQKNSKIGNIWGFTGGSFGGNVWTADGLAPALMTMQGGGKVPMIATYEGDEDDKVSPRIL